MNQSGATPAACEIELADGRTCGVLAVGHCATCGHAFCSTHQARASDGYGQLAPYVDMCAPCLAVKQAEGAKRQKETLAPHNYFMSNLARTDLLTAGVPPVVIYYPTSEWKPGLFGLGGRYVHVLAPLWRGWILGEFEWSCSVNVGAGGPNKYKHVAKNWLTALLDVSHDEEINVHSSNSTPARVQPCSKGYELLAYRVHDFFADGTLLSGQWREAMRAVKRLAGASS